MYETESNSGKASLSEIPAEVISAFGELKEQVVARTLLPWSEHCTECVWPTCYTTCDLYEPREDLRCRRFVGGMVRVDHPLSPNSYLLKISFKRWGKLWAPGRLRLRTMEEAKKIEARDYFIGSKLYQIALPSSLKRVATGKRYSFKKRVAQRGVSDAKGASFVLECYNPNPQTIRLSLTVRSNDAGSKMPYQKLIALAPGFNRERIPAAEIASRIDLAAPFSLEMIPNEVPDGTTLYFGMMDFTQETRTAVHQEERQPDRNEKREKSEKPEKNEKKVKCVVWDLDNTLWDGVLTEDGPENLRLKPGVVEVIQELDRRGILHSIASKNNSEDALAVLRKFGLEEYFLSPQISWNPKGSGVKAIAEALNIGLDTLVFIDDSNFELEQVRNVCPQVRMLPADQYLSLPGLAACQVPVTDEGINRRKMYREDQTRQAAAADPGQDYVEFLKQCNMSILIRPLSPDNLERVHELTQRTNQMNFSGNRYSRDLLREILSKDYLDTYVLTCEDRFGSYGAVGFSIVDRRELRMTDLMFSCRVQSKRVEHAFLAFLIRKYSAALGKDFLANYRKTDRNAPSGAVFADIGMEEAGVADGVTTLVFRKDRTPPDDGIIKIVVQDAVTAGA
jgi:FkbH-like protein